MTDCGHNQKTSFYLFFCLVVFFIFFSCLRSHFIVFNWRCPWANTLCYFLTPKGFKPDMPECSTNQRWLFHMSTWKRAHRFGTGGNFSFQKSWKVICLSHFKQTGQIFPQPVEQVGKLSTTTAAQTNFKRGRKLQKTCSINYHLSILWEIM